jgi:hypothetical protein
MIARTAMRRSTEGLFPAAQLRRPLRFKAIMSRILNPGQVDRQAGSRMSSLGTGLLLDFKALRGVVHPS